MIALLVQLLPIILAQLLVLSLTVFVFLHAPGRNVIKLVVVPLAVLLAVAIPWSFTTQLGYPVRWPLPDKFLFLGYIPRVEKGEKKFLEIWIREGSTSRLLVVPYDKDLDQALAEATAGRQRRHAEVEVHKRGTQKGQLGTEQSPADTKSPYALLYQTPETTPKGGVPTPSQPSQEAPAAPAEPQPPSVLDRYKI